MGLFESIFGEIPLEEEEFLPESEAEAYLSILYSIVQADGDMASEEMENLSRILLQTKIFKEVDVSELMLAANANLKMFGAKALIEAGMKLIPELKKPQLFCFCTDLVLADQKVTPEEEQILSYLASITAIPEETANKIIEVSKIRAGIAIP